MILILVLWPFVGGAVGAWLGRASYDWLALYLSRMHRWRRFDRGMRRLWGAK